MGRARPRLAREGAARRSRDARRWTRREAPISPHSACSGCPGSRRTSGSPTSPRCARGTPSSCRAPRAPSAASPGRSPGCAARACRRERRLAREGRLAPRARVRRCLRLPRGTHEGALREHAPDGIDVYFDNVGGETLEAAIGAMRTYGRIAACGAISRYNATEPTPGPRNLFMVVTKRLRMQGFIVSDHSARRRRRAPTTGASSASR